ncbi:MAG: hypothetical protein HKN12_12485 [Gemmatimonadetes bacterium]|nr:hypothetical protein [Gemmatimonadota bacterium]
MSWASAWKRMWLVNRMFRAVGAAVAMFAAIGFMWWVKMNPPVATERTTATVTDVIESTLNSDASLIVHIELDDGRTGRMTVPSYAARRGAEIPVILEQYKKSDDTIYFDVDRWVDAAGSH